MCGICGMVGFGIGLDDVKMFETMFYLTGLRGLHSTGLMTAKFHTGKTKIELRKKATNVANFIQEDSWMKFEDRQLASYTTDLFMGHCRYATIGEINDKNAHPFRAGNLIGAHNGTLVGKEWLGDKELTDSEVMFNAMAQEGVPDVLRRLPYGSAYAISVFDKNTKKLYLGRNFERPLYIGLNKKYGVLYWASELRILNFAAQRVGGIEMDTFFCEKDTLYEISIDKISAKNRTPWVTHDVKRDLAGYDKMWEEYEKRTDMGMLGMGVMGPTSSLLTRPDDNPPWDESCVICGDPMTEEECKEQGYLNVDGVRYYTCERCETKEVHVG